MHISICPGQHLAEESIWIVVARLLAVFDIHPVKDEDGTSVVAGREPDVTPATRVASPVLSAAGCVTGDPEETCDISVTPAKATIETVESGFAPNSPWTYQIYPLVIFSGKEHERTC